MEKLARIEQGSGFEFFELCSVITFNEYKDKPVFSYCYLMHVLLMLNDCSIVKSKTHTVGGSYSTHHHYHITLN